MTSPSFCSVPARLSACTPRRPCCKALPSGVMSARKPPHSPSAPPHWASPSLCRSRVSSPTTLGAKKLLSAPSRPCSSPPFWSSLPGTSPPCSCFAFSRGSASPSSFQARVPTLQSSGADAKPPDTTASMSRAPRSAALRGASSQG